MRDNIKLLQHSAFDVDFINGNSHRFKKKPSNCISCYRIEEGLSLRKLCGILAMASSRGAKDLCAALHPSAKYIHILALREGLSVSEFLLRYSPTGKDAA